MKNKFWGIYAAILTPFDEKGEVDEEKLRGLVDFLVSKGINGVYVCGGTGEGFLMDVEERKAVAEIVKDEAKDKVNIIAHVGGSLNTKNALELARHAEAIKLDGVSSVPPIYYKYSFAEIFNYYQEVAQSTSLPFFIYHTPLTTGVSLSNVEIAEFSKIKNIVGLKYTHPDFYILQDLLLKMKKRWIAFSGPDELFLPALTMGVTGSIGSTQNVLPEIFVEIYKSFKEGDLKKAIGLQERITVAVSLLLKYGGITSWKTALKFRGIDAGYCRPPFKKKLSLEEEKSFLEEWKNHFPEFTSS